MSEDPFTGANVPAGIAIAEEGFDSIHAAKEKGDGHEEGKIC